MVKFAKLRTAFSAAGLSAMVAIGPASAGPITGGFTVSGDFVPTSSLGVPLTTLLDLLDAVAIDFAVGNIPTPGVPGPITVTSSFGDFTALLPVDTIGSARDFTFAGPSISVGFPAPPIVGFEVFGPVTVDLLDIKILQNEAFLNLQGSTNIHAPAFSTTPGTYFFSGGFSGGTAGVGNFAFVAENGIPEPLSLALVGIGLLSLAVMRRKHV